MNRDEFMKRLEYLLQDIPDEDKADALEYYRDYLEEAGDDAGKAIAEFGSPERIASIIRTDIAGNLEAGGEFTERGYEDERFRDPNYQVAHRYQVPEPREEREKTASEPRDRSPRTSTPLKVVLWIILLIVAAPLWLGAGGVVFGLLTAAIAIIGAFAVSIAVITIAFFIAAIVAGVMGVIHVFANPLGGLLTIGIGLLFLGLAFLLLILAVQFYGRFIPWAIRGVVDTIGGLFWKRGGAR